MNKTNTEELEFVGYRYQYLSPRKMSGRAYLSEGKKTIGITRFDKPRALLFAVYEDEHEKEVEKLVKTFRYGTGK